MLIEQPITQTSLNVDVAGFRNPGPAPPSTNTMIVQQLQQYVQIEIDDDNKNVFEDIRQQTQNIQLKTNNFVFGVLVIFTQLAVVLVYAFVFHAKSSTIGPNQIYEMGIKQTEVAKIFAFQTLQPILLAILTSLICIVGFSTLFAYNRKLIWSPLAYNLLIFSLTIQLYFIFSHLIGLIGIQLTQNNSDGLLLISNKDEQYYPSEYTYKYELGGKTLIDAVKCAIANCVVFSAVLGRAGLIDVWVLCFIGTLGFQFTRAVNSRLGNDFGEVNSMFTYGGFAGLAIGVVIYLRNRYKGIITKQNPNYTGSIYSASFSLIGCTLLIILFPILCMHNSPNASQNFSNMFSTSPYTIYISTTASTMISIGVSLLINSKLCIRDLVNGAISGCVVGMHGAYYVVAPVFAQITGVFGGVLQVLVQNYVEKKVARNGQILHTYSFCLFGVQGLLGAVFASIWKAVTIANKQNFQQQWLSDTSSEAVPIALGLIAAGIGLGTGLIIGLILIALSSYRKTDSMHDRVGFEIFNDQNFLQDESLVIEEFKNMEQFRPGLIPAV